MSDSPAAGSTPSPDTHLFWLAALRGGLLVMSLALLAGWWTSSPGVALLVGVATIAGALNGWTLRGQHHLPSAEELLAARRGTSAAPGVESDPAPSEDTALDSERPVGASGGSATTDLLAELAPELSGLGRNVSALLERLADTGLHGDQVDLLEAAQGAQGQLSTLLADVFDLVRIEAGRLKLRRRDFELRDEMEEVLEQLYPLAWKRGLELSADVDASVPDTIFADPRRLRQVTQHLLRATLRATDTGEVCLKATCRGEGADAVLRLEIRDTAPRRSSAEFERLRQRRPSALESLNELDLALGLSLAEGLAEIMGGSFGVGLDENSGNGLWLEVPIETPVAPDPSEVLEDQILVGRRMLVLEARAAARETLVTAGNRLGLRVDSAADEAQARQVLSEASREGDPIELLLLDDGLGGGQGRETVQRLTGSSRWPRPVTLLLTPTGAAENPAELVRMGVDAWIPKPLRMKRLEEGIRHVLAQFGESPGEAKPTAGNLPSQPAAPAEAISVAPAAVEAEDSDSGRDSDSDVGSDAAQELQGPVAELVLPEGPVRVLLLEPDPALARVQVAVLRSLQCRVDWQDEARACLRQYQDAVYDLVLADQRTLMELGEDGLQGLSAIREGAQDVLIAWEHGLTPTTGGDPAPPTPATGTTERLRCADLELEKPNSPVAVRILLSTLLGDYSSSPADNPALPRPPSPPISVNDEKLPIDPDVIQSLKDLGGEDEPELFRELVGMFLRDTPPRLEALRSALDTGNADELERTAHAMKSSCGNLGAMTLAELCYQLEMVGREGVLESAQSLVERSNAEFKRVTEALESELN